MTFYQKVIDKGCLVCSFDLSNFPINYTNNLAYCDLADVYVSMFMYKNSNLVETITLMML